MNAGDIVKVLPPFTEHFPDNYVIEQSQIADDGQVVYYLEGVFGAFSADHLEVI